MSELAGSPATDENQSVSGLPLPVTTIRPAKGWMPLNLREIWEYRELLYFFVWRDLKVRYKQTILGVVWVVLQPILLTVAFTLIFGTALGFSSVFAPIPYAAGALAGILPWNLFARGLGNASTSLSSNRDLVTKVYFPRLMLPMAEVLAGLVDFAITFVILVGVLAYYGIVPGITVLALPFFIVIATLAALGIGFWFSALDARYRDVQYTIPFLTQIWFFASAVFYPLKNFPAGWRGVLSLNPMVGVVEGFRWALFGGAWSFDVTEWISVIAVVVIFVSGLYYFRRIEKIMADVV